MKKLLYSLLATTSILLVACGNGANTDDSSNSDTGSKGTTEQVTDKNETGDGQVIRVAWWGGQTRHDLTLEAIELFTEETGIKVEAEYTGWDGYWEKLSTQAAGGNLPDVIQMDNAYLNEYDSNSLLVDLTPYTDDGTIDMTNIDDLYQEVLVSDGRVLGVSGGANALGIVYNAEYAEKYDAHLEPGYTYDDIYDLNMKLKEAVEADGGLFHGYDFSNAEYELFVNYARQNGQTLYSEAGDSVGFDTKHLTDYFTWVQKMVEDGAAPTHDIMLSYTSGGDSMVGEGTAYMRTAASNQLLSDQSSSEFDLDVTILPSLDGTHANYIRPSMSWSITEHAQENDAAAMFIDFMTNNLAANEILKGERGVPISSVVREHLADIVEETTKKTFDYLDLVAEYSKPADPLSPPGETEVRGVFLRVVESLKYGQVTPEEAAEQFVQEANSILN